MGRFRFHILLLNLLVWTALCIAQTKPVEPLRRFTEKEMIEDVQILEQVLREIHPGLYLYNDSSKITSLFLDLKNSLKGRQMSEREFRLFVMPSIAKIACGHTILIPSKGYLKKAKKEKLDYFPFPLLALDSSVYILKNSKKDSSKAEGTRLVSIDYKSISFYLEEIEKK